MKRLASILLTLVLLFSVSCKSVSDKKSETSEKIKIVTTLFAQYDFAKKVGGDKVDVSLILPSGVEPHAYEPTPKDIVRMKEADFLIYTGDNMEPWVSKIKDSLKGGNVKVIDASEGIELLGREEKEENEHHHSDNDPHIWLDFDNSIKMIGTIKESLIEKDAGNKDYYEKNASDYINKIRELDKKYKEARSKFKSETIYTGGHFAFAYLAKRYDLKFESPYKGFSPNAEVAPKDIVKIVDALKGKDIKAIYYEELVNPKVAKILSEEAGVEMFLLNGMHNVSKEDLSSGKSYLEFMEDNLKSLIKGLGNE